MILQKGMFLLVHLYYSLRNNNAKVSCEAFNPVKNLSLNGARQPHRTQARIRIYLFTLSKHRLHF